MLQIQRLETLLLAISLAAALVNANAVHAASAIDAAPSTLRSIIATAGPTTHTTRSTNSSQITEFSKSPTQSQSPLALLDSLIYELASARNSSLSAWSTRLNASGSPTATPDQELLDSLIHEVAIAESRLTSSSILIYNNFNTTSQAQSLTHPSGTSGQVPSIAGDATASINSISISESFPSRAPSLLSATNITTSSTSISGGGILIFAQSMSGAAAIPTGPAISTISTIPPGMSIETITSTTCSVLGAMVTTTAAGSTTAQVVPRLCVNGFALLPFGWKKLPSEFCKNRLSLLDFLLQFICDPRTDVPVGVDITEAPKPTPSPNPPQGEPEGQQGQDQDPSYTDSSPSRSRELSDSMTAPSSTSTLSSSSEVCSGSTKMSGACCTSSTVIVIPSAGASTICNVFINTLIDEMKAIGTTFSSIPPSATQLSIPANATRVPAASIDGLFSSFAGLIFSYSNNTSTAKATPTSSLPAMTTSLSPSCIQVFFLSTDNPNSFVCQCSDKTWNHRKAQESYSNCPNQIGSTTLTTLPPQATAPTNGVACTLFIFAPGSPTWGPPFCECSQNLLFLGSCPASLSATATTTLTLSEPAIAGTAALPTFTTDITAAVCTEVPSLSIKCVAPSVASIPSPMMSACTPQCTKVLGVALPEDQQPAYCQCDPTCGGNSRPALNSDGGCPNQVE